MRYGFQCFKSQIKNITYIQLFRGLVTCTFREQIDLIFWTCNDLSVHKMNSRSWALIVPRIEKCSSLNLQLKSKMQYMCVVLFHSTWKEKNNLYTLQPEIKWDLNNQQVELKAFLKVLKCLYFHVKTFKHAPTCKHDQVLSGTKKHGWHFRWCQDYRQIWNSALESFFDLKNIFA